MVWSKNYGSQRLQNWLPPLRTEDHVKHDSQGALILLPKSPELPQHQPPLDGGHDRLEDRGLEQSRLLADRKFKLRFPWVR